MPERNNGIFTSKSIKTGIILITILFVMLISSNAASAANESIKVATNRYIVLDDPRVSGATATGTGFGLPADDWDNTNPNNRWTGKQTTIGVQALYMDGNGTPLSGRTINFALFYPNGSASGITGTDVTDPQGLASFYGNLDNRRAYGQWRVKADIGGVSSNTTFIYNWWGCAYASGGCDNQHSGKNPANKGTATANSPYTASWEEITSQRTDHNTGISTNGWADDYCTVCHNGYDGQPTSSTPGTKDFYTVDTHQSIRCDNSACHSPGTSYASHNAGTITIGSCNGCHTRTDISDKSTLNGVVSNYSNSTAGTYDKYHTPTSTVPCIVCHGPMHNITKPDGSQRFIKNDVTEDSQCKTCHADYNKHSGSVNCTLCHSDDVHAIQVFSQSAGYVNKGSTYQGNCTNCHQNSTFLGTLNASLKAGKYMGSPAPQIKKPLNHSDDLLAGTKWGIHWTSQQTACDYCHSQTQHDLNALGRILRWAPNYQMYGSIGTNTSCASCHYKGDSNYSQMSAAFTSAGKLIPPEITNGTNWNGISTGYYNHSFATSEQYQDQSCKNCHGSLLSTGANMGEFQHNTGIGKAGNPDCVSCHDIGGGQAKVDVANIKASIHLNLNNGGNAGSYNSDNKICWACHTNSTVSGDGKVDASEIPASSHPDSYNVPRKCTQCHMGGGNFNAIIVSEHNSAGTDIRTKPQADTNTSCVNCHMKSEMITTNSDPGGPKSNMANVSHYGSNKTGISPYNIGGVSNCALCHQGSSAFSTEMVNAAWNASISNHSTNYASTNPGCVNCHSSGRIHDSTLTKPALSLPNSAYCLTCHNSTGSATLKNKEQHNGTVDCTKCHLDTNKNIHPIQYLEQGGTTFATTKTNAVNCTNCHQVKLVNFSNAPIIPDPLKHSNSPSNGTLWGTFWTSESGSCFYCHSDTRHNTTALGRINNLLLDPSNTRNGAITNTQWCADCHYSDAANTNYRGNQLSPVPPAITVNNTGVPGWVDHTGYLTAGYKDNVCETCHALNGVSSKTSLNYSHSLDMGMAGGPNCISCHNTSSGTAPKLVDGEVLKNSVHSDLNNASTDTNKACYACHGDGTAPSGHPANYKNPKSCIDCHAGTGNYSAPLIIEHNQAGQDVITSSANCNSCHDNTGMFLPNSGTNGMTTAFMHYLKDVTDTATTPYQHNGPIDTSNCIDCHNGPNTSNPDWGTPVNISTSTKRAHTETTTAQCDTCHNDGTVSTLANVDFHNASIKSAPADDCIACHTSATGPGGIYNAINTASFTSHRNVNTTDNPNVLSNADCKTCHTDINNMYNSGFTTPTKVCSDCHTGSGWLTAAIIDNHQQNGVNITTGVSCALCHNNSVNAAFAYSDNATVGHYTTKTNLIATQDCTYCHKNSINGTKWGGATDPALSISFPHSVSVSTKDDCYACHSSAVNFHNKTLEKPAISTVNCADCHGTDRNMATKKIDSTVFGTGVHKNRICEDCHAGALDTNMNTYSLTTDPARNCTLCHTGTGQLGAPMVKEHNVNGQDVITAGTTCESCHDNSGMYISNTGTNGTGTAISHYLKDVTNTATTPYQHNGPIDTSNCIDCHNGPNTSSPDWGTPVNISTSTKRAHTETTTAQCDSCHNDGTVSTLANVDFHNASIKLASSDDCLSCHRSTTGAGGMYPGIVDVSFGEHININKSDGSNVLSNGDCQSCHYDTSNMSNVLTYTCDNCHTGTGLFGAPQIQNHKPPEAAVTPGGAITTGAYCSICHNNSINTFLYSANATVSHYGTNSSLLKPTINQTTMPRFGFFTLADASANNKECANCHNPSNSIYGNATFISNAHTPTGTCVQCHVSGNADNLHNSSLGMPVTFQCKECHTTKADQYKAPNLTGTSHGSFTCGSSATCHIPGGQFNNSDMHNYSFNYAGTGPTTPTVYLNGVATTLTVTQGTPVTITSTINDASGAASRVRGAEYFIDQNPGSDPNFYGKGNPLNATDGIFNAASEPVTASISGLSEGTYTIYVRGIDIGKQWSPSGVATLIITAPKGFINGTVKNGSIAGEPVPGVTITAGTVSAVTDGSGNYSLSLPTGTYTLNATKDPEFNAISIPNVEVAAPGTTQQNIFMIKKATGTITGVVTN